MSESDNTSAFFDKTEDGQSRKIKTIEFISNGPLPNAEAITKALKDQGYLVFDLQRGLDKVFCSLPCRDSRPSTSYSKIRPAIAGSELAELFINVVFKPLIGLYSDGEGDLKVAILNGPRSLFFEHDGTDTRMGVVKESYHHLLGYLGDDFIATCVLYPDKFFVHRGGMSIDEYENYPAQFDLELTLDITTLPLGVLLGSLERILP